MSIAPSATIEQASSKQSAALAGRFASEYLHALPPGGQFSAREFCDRFPECARFKSVVLEVTLEEYVRRTCAGDAVAPSEIAGQFPAYRTAIARQIEVYQFLEETSGLEHADDWPEPGDEFLGLQLHELLGTGAFAKVFRATERRLGDRQVVVKVCRGAGAEAAFLGRLGHPHITPIHWHQVCEETGLSAIVMPYLARSTMADVIDLCFSFGRLPERAADVAEAVDNLHAGTGLSVDQAAFSGLFADGALRWTRQLVDALAFAHQHHICHSDIKPSNVLMTPAGNAVLVDFSMANDLEIDRKTIGGTFPYMAPEQLKAFLSGQDIPVSFATDLFSLGVTLYEFLTGQLPFGHPPADASRHATAQWFLERHRQSVVPVTLANPQIPESISTIVLKCIALDPADRPGSAAQLLKRLHHESATTQRLLNAGRRHIRKLLAVSASLLIAASLAVLYAPTTRPPRYMVDLEQGRTALAAGNFQAALPNLDRAIAALPPDDSDNRALAFFLRGSARNQVGMFEDARLDFADANALARENGCIIAALGFCEARVALLQRNRGRGTDDHLATARRLFGRAIECDWGTPEVLFNLAYLDFRQAPTGKPEPDVVLDQAARDVRRKTELDDIGRRLDTLRDALGDTPNYHLLLIQVEIERASLEGRRINTVIVDRATQQFESDLRILLEASRCCAINAQRHDNGLIGEDDLARCAQFWGRAVDKGATETHFKGLATLHPGIIDDPRFEPAPPDDPGAPGSPPDLLLNPVKAGTPPLSGTIGA